MTKYRIVKADGEIFKYRVERYKEIIYNEEWMWTWEDSFRWLWVAKLALKGIIKKNNAKELEPVVVYEVEG